jgi:heme-degrading monooxygenase HmoA
VTERPVLTVFRSRLRPDHTETYEVWATRMEDLATGQPGFLEFKTFESEDGERLSLIVFEDQESQANWRNHPEHRAAQELGRRDFYADYDIAVCEVLGRRRFSHAD